MLAQALDKKVTTTQRGKTRTLTWFAAGVEQLVGQFAKGDRHARKDLFALAEQVGLDLLGRQKMALEEALAPNQEAMLYEFVAKQYDTVAPREPVLAPPELLDDGADDETEK